MHTCYDETLIKAGYSYKLKYNKSNNNEYRHNYNEIIIMKYNVIEINLIVSTIMARSIIASEILNGKLTI